MTPSSTFYAGLEEGEVSDSQDKAGPSRKRKKSKAKRKRSPFESSMQPSSSKHWKTSTDHATQPAQGPEANNPDTNAQLSKSRQDAKRKRSLSDCSKQNLSFGIAGHSNELATQSTQRLGNTNCSATSQPPKKKQRGKGKSKKVQTTTALSTKIPDGHNFRQIKKPAEQKKKEYKNSERSIYDFYVQRTFLNRAGRPNYDTTLCAHCLLQTAPSITIDPAPFAPAVTRKFLKREYSSGGNQQGGLSQLLMNSRDGHCMPERTCIFLPPDVYHVPTAPGQRGMFVTGRREWYKPESVRIFRQRSGGNWLYCGEYVLDYVRPATVDEMEDHGEHPTRVRHLAALVRGQHVPSLQRLRAIVRKFKIEGRVSEDEIAREAASNLNYTDDELDISEIEAALRGEVIKLDLVVLRCLGYDHSFANHLTLRWASAQGSDK